MQRAALSVAMAFVLALSTRPWRRRATVPDLWTRSSRASVKQVTDSSANTSASSRISCPAPTRSLLVTCPSALSLNLPMPIFRNIPPFSGHAVAAVAANAVIESLGPDGLGRHVASLIKMMVWTAPPKRHRVPRRGRWSATNGETVHERTYQNWRRFGQDPFSASCGWARRRRRRERQIEPVEDTSVFCPDRAVSGRHGGMRLGTQLGARTCSDGT